MKLNEKNVASFASCSSPIDKEGYLGKRGDFNKGYQRRWFVLKGNLLFYFEKKQDKEPLGLIVLEACSVQVSSQAKYAFEISFDGPGTRVYLMMADNEEDMESWMKAISHASYEYMRSIVDELQRRVNVLTSSSKTDAKTSASEMSLLHVGPAKTLAHQKPKLPPPGAGVVVKKSDTSSARVENGILVDFSESQPEPPPIPRKTKSLYHQSQVAQVKESSSQPSSPSLTKMAIAAAPYSSPYVLTSQTNTSKPLSPPSTFDRTAVLQPTTAPSEAFATPTSSSGPKSKQMAAPLDSNKSFYQMHEDFSRAVSALRQERNAGSSKHS